MYSKYQTFFSFDLNHESDVVIAQNMQNAQQFAFQKLQNFINKENNITKEINAKEQEIINNTWFKNQLNIQSDDELKRILSKEQMDSVAYAIYNIHHNQEFIVGDKTGIGKGRILASIVRYALYQKRNILFFTENSGLFTDFYRDLCNVGANQYFDLENELFLFHGQAKMYNQKAELLLKNASTKNMKEMIEKGKFEYTLRNKLYSFQPKIIMTTYSQFNNLITGNQKLGLLAEFLKKDSIIICDEFHNTVGDSNINEIKEKIFALNGNIIYSSATFANEYKHLKSLKNILNLKVERDIKVLDSLDLTEGHELENQIAYYMTKNLMLLRREHTHIRKTNYQYIDEISQNKLDFQIQQFRAIILSLFKLFNLAQNILLEEENNEKDYKGVEKSKKEQKLLQNKWQSLGSTINRMARTILLLNKKDDLIKRIEKSLAKNQKCVITLESTFESLIEQCLEYQEKRNKTQVVYKNMGFHTLLHIMVDDLMESFVKKHKKNKELAQMYQNIHQEISHFPDLSLSFIDDVIVYFEKKNLPVLEISGRKTCVRQNENNEYVVENRNVEEKAVIINKFNNGFENKNYDIIIITRSGSTGTSLHASSDFLDQRQRKMFEVEISRRVKVREQFLGRVERRGQVIEPEYETIISQLIFEKRIIAIEEKKMLKMRAMSGSDYQTQSIDFDYYTERMNKIAAQYLFDNINISKLLGIHLYGDKPQYYFIDKLLNRSILLSDEEQEELTDFLDKSYEINQQQMKHYNECVKPSFHQNIMFKSFHDIWCNQPDDHEYQKLKTISKIEKLDTMMPSVYLLETISENQLQEIKSNDLKQNLINNQKQFGKINYETSLFHLTQATQKIYQNNPMIVDNLKKIMLITIGSVITFHYQNNKYVGYVENIQYPLPNEKQLIRNSNNFLYHIRLINPIHLNEYKRILAETIIISAMDLAENKELNVYEDKQIDFNKMARNNEKVQSKGFFLVGNMFYLNYFQQLYKNTEILQFDKIINQQKQQLFCLKLPNQFTPNNIIQNFQNLPIANIKQLYTNLKAHKKITDFKGDVIMYKETKHNGKEYITLNHLILSNKFMLSDNIGYMEMQLLKDVYNTINKTSQHFIFNQEQLTQFNKLIFKIFNKKQINFHIKK